MQSLSASLPQSYPLRPIASLSPGPQQVRFDGIVTNITLHKIHSRSDQAAEGYLKLIIRDSSCEISVNLWYADTSYDGIRLSQQLRVSTTHISSTVTTGMTSDAIQSLPTCLMTSIFPEKDSGCSIDACTDCQYQNINLAGLFNQINIISLSDLMQKDGNEQLNACILVAVSNLGIPATVTTKTNTPFHMLKLEVLDHSSLHGSTVAGASFSACSLYLSSPLFSSAAEFVAKHTTLLISSPRVLSASHHKVKLTSRSQIFIDPGISDTISLRKWIKCIFPGPVSPLDFKNELGCYCTSKIAAAIRGSLQDASPRRQYTFALYLEEIRLRQQQKIQSMLRRRCSSSNRSFVGYVSVLITQISLVNLYKRRQLFCGVCSRCGKEAFANMLTINHACDKPSEMQPVDSVVDGAECVLSTNTGNCSALNLSLNPQILSGVSDETGGILLKSEHEKHNLEFTEDAIHGLTGLKRKDFESFGNSIFVFNLSTTSSKGSLSGLNGSEDATLARLHWIERQVLWSRVTLLLGWTGGCTKGDCKSLHGLGSPRTEAGINCCGQGRIVILQVLS